MTPRPFLASFVALAVAGCGGATSSGPTSTVQPNAAAEPAIPAAPAGPATEAPAGAPAGAKRPTAPGPNQTADGVVFNFKPEAGTGGKKIYLAGNFNDWKPDNPQYLMSNDGSGTFTITVKLPPGEYQYKYVVEGTKWVKDPYSPGDAPDGFGGQNGKFSVK